MRVGVDARALTSGRGVARFTRSLLGALAEVAPGDEWLAFVPGREPVAPVHARVRIVRHRFGGRPLFAAAALARRPRLDRLAGGDVDVVWLPAPAPVATTAGVPYVLTVHDRSFEARPGDFTAYERLWLRVARPRRLAAGATRVVVDSEAVRSELAVAWGADAVVIAPGPGLVPRPNASGGRAPAAEPAGLPARYLLFVGALEPRKAPDVLVRAFARARARGLDAELVLAGDGRLAPRLAGPGVRLVGAVSDERLDALYRGALAVVAPSWVEGFGLAAIEAAARGTPAIVSDLPVFDETIGDGALRVAPGDVAGLAGALVRVAADAQLRERLAVAGARAVAPLSWDRAAVALRAVLAEAAGA